ncbi:hypothetical protein K443DRAFT_678260 [Laccaria amethystina LaAM-08-1]|uniref:Uncharacterized protein n=1 Tax=Laccaria amethystina LaAM-08-1 TaxID=1095629 RepID=A0A0C9WS70_9AGAR|nr:hypothetical protein K443DRAFT_678260 [Laccaria amethystina LaAM-08-1]
MPVPFFHSRVPAAHPAFIVQSELLKDLPSGSPSTASCPRSSSSPFSLESVHPGRGVDTSWIVVNVNLEQIYGGRKL